MNRMTATVSAMFLMASGFASAQEGGEHAPPKPTPFHKHLKQFVGNWDAKTKFLMEPGKPPVESTGNERVKLVRGGLWLILDFKGKMEGKQFTGHGVLGYDSKEKKYVSSWIDSMSENLMVSEGTCDEAGKIFTMVYKGPDPHSGEPMTMKQVTEVTGEDTRKLSFLVKTPDGKFMEVGTIEYTRKEKKKKKKE